MLFNSYIFILVFFPIVLLAFSAVSGRYAPVAVALLFVASVLFYSWSSPWLHVVLLLASIAFNFTVGRGLLIRTGKRTRTALLAFGVTGDLLTLAYFKYSSFLLAQIGLGGLVGDVFLPLGISFYTFTQIAYLVDVYRGEAREYSASNFALFVTWFPHLIAGPIIHHKEMMPQFAEVFRRRFQPVLAMGGLSIFVVGLAKKLLLADQFATLADPVFQNATQLHLTFVEAWIGVLAYTLQVYFDFSGYSDMAIGLSLMFGVRLPVNFNSPYKASSMIDFWRRWHMTLSRFLRDYLYIPLGGSRKGPIRRYINLMLTMLIGGLWHGAGWTFVIWGGLHGSYLIINHAWRRVNIRLPYAVSVAVTFTAVVVAWVFFRAQDISSAWSVLGSMCLGHGLSLPPSWLGIVPFTSSFGLHFDGAFHNELLYRVPAVAAVVVGLCIVWFCPNTQELFGRLDAVLWPKSTEAVEVAPRVTWCPNWRWALVLGIMFAACFIKLGGQSPFLYFRF